MSHDKEGKDTERKPINLAVEPHPTPETTDMGKGGAGCGPKTGKGGCNRNTRPGCSGPPPEDEDG